ncbi:hypothetical protein [Profundibacter sp.]
MTANLAINGFGRIGRNILRAISMIQISTGAAKAVGLVLPKALEAPERPSVAIVGGAFWEWSEGKTLPGLTALSN